MMRRSLPVTLAFLALAASTTALDDPERLRALFAITFLACFVFLVFWEPLLVTGRRPRPVALTETVRYGLVEGELVRVMGPDAGGVLVKRSDGRCHTIPTGWVQPVGTDDSPGLEA